LPDGRPAHFRRRSGSSLLRLLPLLLVAAGPPRDREPRRPEADFVCPEKLPDDEARIRAARKFVERYGARRPRSRMGERLAARQRLLTAHGCRAETLIHTFPES
jgi:hypothetical protein